HQQSFSPDHMVFSVVGNLSEEEAVALITRHFGDMKSTAQKRYRVSKTFASNASVKEFNRDVEQGYVVIGHTTCAISHEDVPALSVASGVLGAGMSSRLFSDLRDKQSLAYAVGAFDVEYQ